MENRVAKGKSLDRFRFDAGCDEDQAVIYDDLYGGCEYCACAAEDVEFICAAINAADRLALS